MKPRHYVLLIVLFIIAAVGGAIITAKYGPGSETTKQRVAAEKESKESQQKLEAQKFQQWVQQKRQEKADMLVGGLLYMQDPRTKLCFAFFDDTWHNSPAMACVPCEKIPPDLLTVGNPNVKSK